MKQDMIVILDLGSHENTVVARAVRALGVYSEIYPHDITAQELKALPNVKGIIINGGPNNVIDGVEIDVLPEIYEAGFPVMAAGHNKAKCEVKLPAFTNDEEAVKAAVESFVLDTCKAEKNWNMTNFVNDQVELIRKQVGDRKVLLALSWPAAITGKPASYISLRTSISTPSITLLGPPLMMIPLTLGSAFNSCAVMS